MMAIITAQEVTFATATRPPMMAPCLQRLPLLPCRAPDILLRLGDYIKQAHYFMHVDFLFFTIFRAAHHH